MDKHSLRPPVWLILVIVVLVLPLFSWPFIITNYIDNKDEYSVLMFIFPIYVVWSVYLAYKTYNTRKALSIILLSLILLSYAAAALVLFS